MNSIKEMWQWFCENDRAFWKEWPIGVGYYIQNYGPWFREMRGGQ